MRFSRFVPFLLCLFILLQSNVIGSTRQAQSESLSSEPPIKLSPPMSRNIQKLTGLNALTSWLTEKMIEHELEKQLQGNFKVTLIPFSAFDLLSGKAHQIKIQGENGFYSRFLPFQRMEMVSDPATPIFVALRQKNPMILRPIEVQVLAQMTESDMNRALRSPEGQKLLTNIPVDIPPIGTQHFDVLNPRVAFENANLIFSGQVNLSGKSPEHSLPIHVRTQFAADNQQQSIRLTHVELNIEGFHDLSLFSKLIEEHFGKVIRFSHLKLKGHRLRFQMEDPQVIDKTFHIKGMVTISPTRNPSSTAQLKHDNH